MNANFQIKSLSSDLDIFVFRFLIEEDLPKLEWEGEFTHFRKMYAEAFRRSLTGKSLLWVVELSGWGIVGQAFIQLMSGRPEIANGRDYAYIYAFRIRESFRGIGLGSRLIKLIEKDLYQRGLSIATLNVAIDNPSARRLYERHGYQIMGYDPGCWSYEDHQNKRQYVNEPSWRMRKKISGFSGYQE